MSIGFLERQKQKQEQQEATQRPISERQLQAQVISRSRWAYFGYYGRVTSVLGLFKSISIHPMSTEETQNLAKELDALIQKLYESMKTRAPVK